MPNPSLATNIYGLHIYVCSLFLAVFMHYSSCIYHFSMFTDVILYQSSLCIFVTNGLEIMEKLLIVFSIGAGLVYLISFLLECEYINYLVHAKMMSQGIAMCVSYILLQEV